jgi:hypothetical protein
MSMKRVFNPKRNASSEPNVGLALNAIEMQKAKILGKLEEHERKFAAKQFLAHNSLIHLEQKEVLLL